MISNSVRHIIIQIYILLGDRDRARFLLTDEKSDIYDETTYIAKKMLILKGDTVDITGSGSATTDRCFERFNLFQKVLMLRKLKVLKEFKSALKALVNERVANFIYLMNTKSTIICGGDYEKVDEEEYIEII